MRNAVHTSGFTLVELMVVFAIVGVLMALLLPAMAGVLATADQTVCASNLRQIGLAMSLYLKNNNNWFFPLCSDERPDGRWWYYGVEPNGSPARGEGNRLLDRSRARLAPYLEEPEKVGVCPQFPFSGPYKAKYIGDPWTYGINRCLSTHPLPGKGNVNGNGNDSYGSIRPGDASRTPVFADSAQVTTLLAPASAANPMIEEFPYIEPGKKYVQFRHHGKANVLFADWHVEALPPAAGSYNSLLRDACIGSLDEQQVLFDPRLQ
jgi:prepilin-type processing-associated H-X9-DG protein/prepilin-type N-terminal cleavage/methylation domain-containing protein